MDFQVASMSQTSATNSSIPSKIILKNTTGVSLNERFLICLYFYDILMKSLII